MRTKLLAASAAAVLLTSVGLGTLRYLGIVLPERPGPLGSSAGNLHSRPVEPRKAFSISFFVPENESGTPIVLEGIRLIGASQQLRMLGAGVQTCGRCPRALGYGRWPPPALRLKPVDGYHLRPGWSRVLVVGFIAPDPGNYRVRGLILTYRQGARAFQTELGPRRLLKAQGKTAG